MMYLTYYLIRLWFDIIYIYIQVDICWLTHILMSRFPSVYEYEKLRKI